MKKKIKLVTVLNGLGMGGAEHVAYEIIKNLDYDKYEPHVICYGERLNTPLENDMDAICQVDYLGLSGPIGIKEMIRVMRHISRTTPDIIHAHMGGVTFSIPWALFHRKPLVVTVHTKPEKAFSKKNEKLLRYALSKKGTKVVAVSEDNYAKVKTYLGIDDDRIQFVNNGIDIEKYHNKAHDGFVFLNVARQDDNKNQASIIRAFDIIKETNSNTYLYLVGDGPTHDALEKMIADRKLQDMVFLPGMTSSPEYYYAMADVYIQSSHREAMPLSVLEAMAAGLPIISTDVGGMRDVVKENGILINDNSDQELIDAMNLLINETKDDRRYRASESKRIVERYSSREMAIKYMGIYCSLLE